MVFVVDFQVSSRVQKKHKTLFFFSSLLGFGFCTKLVLITMRHRNSGRIIVLKLCQTEECKGFQSTLKDAVIAQPLPFSPMVNASQGRSKF